VSDVVLPSFALQQLIQQICRISFTLIQSHTYFYPIRIIYILMTHINFLSCKDLDPYILNFYSRKKL